MSSLSEAWDRVHANKGLTITIHLNETEVGNIGGWVNKGFTEPAFADFPWKLVLEEQTRARFEAIAAQFVQAGLCSYPAGWNGAPIEQPPAPPIEPPPSGTPPIEPVRECDFTMKIPFDDFNRRETRLQLQFGSVETRENGVSKYVDNKYAIAFEIPGAFSSPGYFSVAEFDGAPWPRHLTLSEYPFDFRPIDPTGANGPLDAGYGKQATLYFNSGGSGAMGLVPGKTYYMNFRNFDNTVGHSNLAPGQLVNAGYSFVWPHN